MLILFFIREFTDVEYFFEYTNYTFYVDSPLYPFLLRAFHYVGGLIICGFLLMVFPNKKTFLTWFGKNSLILYISHAAVIQLLTLRPILKFNSWMQLVLSESFILAILFVLAIIIKKCIKYIRSSRNNLINNLNQ